MHDIKFLALLGASYIYDISWLRIKFALKMHTAQVGYTVYF
jgi:hypothetical protein